MGRGGGGGGRAGAGGGGTRVASIGPAGTFGFRVRSGGQTLDVDVRDTSPSRIFTALFGQSTSGDIIRVNLGRGDNRINPQVEREALRRAGLTGLAAARASSRGFVDVSVP